MAEEHVDRGVLKVIELVGISGSPSPTRCASA